MSETRGGRYLGLLTLVSGVALCLVVAGVGAVAVGAEFRQDWTAYHTMEQAMALATPVAVGLLGLTVLLGLAAITRT